MFREKMNVKKRETHVWLQKVHPSWQPFLSDEIRSLLVKIAGIVGTCFLPDTENVLRFLQTDLKRLKVVILGQDPYPSTGAATGRAFEVGGLVSWQDAFRQVSLKNIVRALWLQNEAANHRNCLSMSSSDPTMAPKSTYPPPFSQVLKDITNGRFAIAKPNTLFQNWEEQGVLLLNTSFTVQAGNPGVHKEIWIPFTERLLAFLSQYSPNLHWFLWGTHAASWTHVIRTGTSYISRHPMMCSEKYSDDFLKSPCFAATAYVIQWNGISAP